MSENIDTSKIKIGVAGLGLMGTSIVTTFLRAGHQVTAIAPLPSDIVVAPEHIHNQLTYCETSNLLSHPLDFYRSNLTITEDYSQLAGCGLVLECVVEEEGIKAGVYQKIAKEVGDDTIIASNTSAIPISSLQKHVPHPERFMGIHWGEPAYLSRFLEITCGEQTAIHHAEWVFKLAYHWDKEPTLLRKDIRGFVTNRLMYATYREALKIIENGEATLEDADKMFKYDAGSWITLMGLFRRMDYVGLKDYPVIFKNIFPTLSNHESIPPIMQELIDRKAKGTKNAKGLYDYTEEEAKLWDEAFSSFNLSMYNLGKEYPSDIKKTKLKPEE